MLGIRRSHGDWTAELAARLNNRSLGQSTRPATLCQPGPPRVEAVIAPRTPERPHEDLKAIDEECPGDRGPDSDGLIRRQQPDDGNERNETDYQSEPKILPKPVALQWCPEWIFLVQLRNPHRRSLVPGARAAAGLRVPPSWLRCPSTTRRKLVKVGSSSFRGSWVVEINTTGSTAPTTSAIKS